MTEAGAVRADLVVENGRICSLETSGLQSREPAPDDIDAAGLHICPGMIDLNLHLPDGITKEELGMDALRSGITTAVVAPERSGPVALMHGGEQERTGSWYLSSETVRDRSELENMLQACARRRALCFVSVRSVEAARRVLHSCTVGRRVALLHLNNCGEVAGEIARAGFGAVLGIGAGVREEEVHPAARLSQLGATVAVTANYPHTALRYLHVCAAICSGENGDEERALSSVTSSPAQMLGLADRGRIEPGMRADLAFFSGEPMRVRSQCCMTLLDGRRVL